ncbi:Abi family protein [Hydrogenovibrio halophilus]|uniref:Abi family protein n=1 Tax=Hydrogenovibrio halophilus TaxID=373391 RepID=UPI0003792939|nr:Abi family protein [Hydrogenovibrio halophilus]
MPQQKRHFQKQALTPEKLLKKYESNGLIVPDDQRDLALKYFRFVGAYRLKGYMFDHFDERTKQFTQNYELDDLIQQYEFDRELRLITIDAIDRIEVAVRASISNHLSLSHSPHWFLDKTLFKSTRHWDYAKLCKKLEEEVRNGRKKRFIQHYYDHYEFPEYPPSWAMSEIISFGFWSKTYAILKNPNDRKAISMKFEIDQPEVFRSWVHALSVLRNHAAHHSQILRTPLRVKPTNYKRKQIRFHRPDQFASMVVIINYFLGQIGLNDGWDKQLERLFESYPKVDRADLGL